MQDLWIHKIFSIFVLWHTWGWLIAETCSVDYDIQWNELRTKEICLMISLIIIIIIIIIPGITKKVIIIVFIVRKIFQLMLILLRR
jgi:hypothetical protein